MPLKGSKVTFVNQLFLHNSELWRKETTLTQNLSSLKEDLSKADQALRSMAGKVSNLLMFFNYRYGKTAYIDYALCPCITLSVVYMKSDVVCKK